MLNLDIGCGPNKRDGFNGMDKREYPDIDIVHDIEDIPWPIESESVYAINASHVLEHMKPWNIIDIMNECWRVLEPEGAIDIKVPYGIAFDTDPTHSLRFNLSSFWYFDKSKNLYKTYKPKPWKTIHGSNDQRKLELRTVMMKLKE